MKEKRKEEDGRRGEGEIKIGRREVEGEEEVEEGRSRKCRR
jgi:hypothetical protein